MPNRCATLLLLLAFVVGCGSDSPAGPGGQGGPANGNMTALIDGTAWTASIITPGMTTGGSGGFSAIGAGNSTATIGFAWPDQGPGTYTIPSSIGFNGNMTLTAGGTWSAGSNQGSGTLMVTMRTANRITGTFQFVMHASPGTGATGTRTISNGTFDIAF